MSSKQLLRLFPQPPAACTLQNVYLQQFGWRQTGREKPVVAANFVTSLDGRIAATTRANPELHLPKSLTSGEDFRLFLELHAQADCLITHGKYMRSLAAYELGNILQLPHTPEYEDLHAWRRQQGLREHPDVVIASSSLEFPLHPSLKEGGQKVYVAAGQATDPARHRHWQAQGLEVLLAGKSGSVQGRPLIDALALRGYRSIYLIAGPRMLHTMLEDRQLDRLYISVSHQVLGGQTFRTLLEGETLTHCTFRLSSLLLDEVSDNGCGQFFAGYECIYDT